LLNLGQFVLVAGACLVLLVARGGYRLLPVRYGNERRYFRFGRKYGFVSAMNEARFASCY
jgi:hypothetical protein